MAVICEPQSEYEFQISLRMRTKLYDFFHLRVGLGLQIRNGERSKFLALFKGNIHNKDAKHDDLICFVYPQLSCYSEFNKMVHALSVHSKGETVSTLNPPR